MNRIAVTLALILSLIKNIFTYNVNIRSRCFFARFIGWRSRKKIYFCTKHTHKKAILQSIYHYDLHVRTMHFLLLLYILVNVNPSRGSKKWLNCNQYQSQLICKTTEIHYYKPVSYLSCAHFLICDSKVAPTIENFSGSVVMSRMISTPVWKKRIS